MSGSRAHTEALLAFLRADPQLASIVFDGFVKGQAPTRYVLVFGHRPEHASSRMAESARGVEARVTVHCIGSIPAEAEWLADRVAARLTPGTPSVRLMVAGRVQGAVRHVDGRPMRVDSTVPPAVYFFADDYAWEASP